MSLKYEPSSEPLHISGKYSFSLPGAVRNSKEEQASSCASTCAALPAQNSDEITYDVRDC